LRSYDLIPPAPSPEREGVKEKSLSLRRGIKGEVK